MGESWRTGHGLGLGWGVWRAGSRALMVNRCLTTLFPKGAASVHPLKPLHRITIEDEPGQKTVGAGGPGRGLLFLFTRFFQ